MAEVISLTLTQAYNVQTFFALYPKKKEDRLNGNCKETCCKKDGCSEEKDDQEGRSQKASRQEACCKEACCQKAGREEKVVRLGNKMACLFIHLNEEQAVFFDGDFEIWEERKAESAYSTLTNYNEMSPSLEIPPHTHF